MMYYLYKYLKVALFNKVGVGLLPPPSMGLQNAKYVH